ncbi:acetolactate synthase 2 small subunit [Enterobacteriaceae endosymbiont of Neohaemonia nigricornis]|uniref:acetolactate synthase 2 small subunit n=1 Tax=Enterobacteriaceae endosymbiont of Neohaemonia nigricornis TaxID=2675792 RepID=UPI00144A1538|nr:acetolactate synthase 2 small subunit [Enterobacteriaceae endosymbiont of Neohaemonia nigricornis]QJC30381.1 acetolactate synthase 2 small subunit [Enterobacteriaceae endosymbiont of Neohaemonia nigricornis]
MKQYNLYITTNINQDVIERIIRIIRHRGFILYNMKMNTDKNTNKMLFQLTIMSYKTIELLVKQIFKLIDVLDIIIR